MLAHKDEGLYFCLCKLVSCFLSFGCCLTGDAFVLSTSNMEVRIDLFRLLGRKSPFLPLRQHLKGEWVCHILWGHDSGTCLHSWHWHTDPLILMFVLIDLICHPYSKQGSVPKVGWHHVEQLPQTTLWVGTWKDLPLWHSCVKVLSNSLFPNFLSSGSTCVCIINKKNFQSNLTPRPRLPS